MYTQIKNMFNLKGDKNKSGAFSCLSCPPASSNRIDNVLINNVSPTDCPCVSTFTDIPKFNTICKCLIKF